VLLATTAVGAHPTAVGRADEPYQFEGVLAYRAWDGTLIPVVPDVVLVGVGDGRCQFTLQSIEQLRVGRDGRFNLKVEELTTEVQRRVDILPDGSPGKPYCVENTSWPCYRFRASGCDDRILQFGAKPPAGLVEMNCPRRRGPRPRHDG